MATQIMLGFSAEDFNTAIIKMLQQAIMSTHKTSEKKSLSNERKYKEEPSGNFRTEDCNNWNLKDSVGGLNNRMEGAEKKKKISELKE